MSDRANRRPILSWACGILILLLWASSLRPWIAALSLHGAYSPVSGWQWQPYDTAPRVDLADGSKYFFGGSFVLILAALWMIVPQFRRAKLDEAPAVVPLATALFGITALARWLVDYNRIDRQYRAEFGTGLSVVADPAVLLAALAIVLLLVFGAIYAWKGRRPAALPPPPPIPD